MEAVPPWQTETLAGSTVTVGLALTLTDTVTGSELQPSVVPTTVSVEVPADSVLTL